MEPWQPSRREVEAGIAAAEALLPLDEVRKERLIVDILVAANGAPGREPERAGDMLERLDHKAEDFDDGD